MLVNPTDRSNETTLHDVEAAAIGQEALALEAAKSLEREKVDARGKALD